MADLITIARPYALAAFDCARESQQLAAWEAFLQAAGMVTENTTVQRLLANPETSAAQLYELYSGVLATQLDDQRKNFLHILANNKRLNLLPQIHQSFNMYIAALENISKVRVVTAIELNETMKQKFTAALAKRIQRDVSLECKVDPSIIAGAIFYIGDSVIDDSVRGKLSRLQQTLTA